MNKRRTRKKVIVGGTFDILHNGHKALLKRAFSLGKVTIGLTSDTLAKKIKKRKVNDFKYRKKVLASFLRKEFRIETKIIKIENKFGPTLKEDFDYIVVSPKTYETALLINKIRLKNNKKPIYIILKKLVLAEDRKPISCERILKKKIDVIGQLMG